MIDGQERRASGRAEEQAPECGQGMDLTAHGVVSSVAPPDRKAETPAGLTQPGGTDLARLRALLFQREIALLDGLKSRLDSPTEQAKEMSNVIAEALVLRASRDERLNLALEPIVESIFKTSLRKNRRDFANLLFPLMGPSIRKAIAEAFRSMLEGFNKSIETSFSWKGLRWRLEALRTGKPFSEVVLLHNLIYRVEEIYFIHSATGIDIAHVVNEGVDSRDAGMISAMLTAIQDFVRDCFVSGKDGDLESLRHGEYTVLLEKHELAYIACLVRGNPPASFRDQLRTCLEHLLVEFADPLETFSGDTRPFLPAVRSLDQLLSARFVDDDKPLPLWVRALPVLLLLVLAGGLGWWKYQKAEAEDLRMAAYQAKSHIVDLLRTEPGLLLIHVEPHDDGPWKIFCLKDKLARSPDKVVQELGADPAAFAFTVVPHLSYHPAIVTDRALRKLNPPETATLRFTEDGTLHFAGTAPMRWILQAKQEALGIPGIARLDMSQLSDPRMEQITSLVDDIEGTVIEFALNQDAPVPEDTAKLTNVVESLVKLEDLAQKMGFTASLTIYGYADATGQDKRNYEISQARAKTIAVMLYMKGSSMPVSIYGMGAERAQEGDGPTKPKQSSRRIEFRVHLAQAGTALLELLGN